MLWRRRALRLDSNSSHVERLTAIVSAEELCKRNLRKCRQARILEAAERKSSLKKCRRDLQEYHVPMTALFNRDGIPTSSYCEMESIMERFHTNLFSSSTPVPDPDNPTGELPLRILPAKVRAAVDSMKSIIALGPEHLSAGLLRNGDHCMHENIAVHRTSCLQRERILDQWRTSRTPLLYKKGGREDIRNYRPMLVELAVQAFHEDHTRSHM